MVKVSIQTLVAIWSGQSCTLMCIELAIDEQEDFDFACEPLDLDLMVDLQTYLFHLH